MSENTNQSLLGLRSRTIDTSLSNLQGELFDIVVATANLLESYDASSTEFMDKAFNEDLSTQEIIELVISHLENMLISVDVNVKFEREDYEGWNGVRLIPIYDDISEDGVDA